MPAKSKKSKSKKKLKAPTTGSSIISALVGTVLNMTATLTTVGSVVLCLIVANDFA